MSRHQPLSVEQRAGWDSAMALWGVRMHEARSEPRAGQPSFAWFSFPPSITVDPVVAKKLGVDAMWGSIFAHELGHHVLSPSTRIVDLKIRQQLARAISATAVRAPQSLAGMAGFLGNLWSDMLINVRVAELQRRADPSARPEMIRMWGVLETRHTDQPLWWVTMHAYEELWGLPNGSLCDVVPPVIALTPVGMDYTSLFASDPVVDAALVADAVRIFADDPIRGALRYGMIMAPYLLADEEQATTARHLVACAGDIDGAAAPSAAELDEVMRDARLREQPLHPAAATESRSTEGAASEAGSAGSQGYGLAATLRLYDANLESTVMDAWYCAEARSFVKPYRQAATATANGETVPAALELWSLDDELEQIDWPATLTASPRVIPGITTRLRTHVTDDALRLRESVHLDLYVDCSGSMPNPSAESPAILAGTILILSVLRGGGRVRVTSFSGPGQVAGDELFSRERGACMRRLLTFFGGGTTFPLDLLERRYSAPGPSAGGPTARRHLVVISDEGLDSYFGRGQQEHDGVAGAVRARLDTATLLVMDPQHSIAEPAARTGYDVEYLKSMDDAPAACGRLASRIAHYGELEAAHG